MKRFYTKCCKADILYNKETNIDYCSKCMKILKDKDIKENLNE